MTFTISEGSDVAGHLAHLQRHIADEEWLLDDGRAAERIAEAKLTIKNLKSGAWRLVRLTGEQHRLLCVVLTPHAPGLWAKIDFLPGVHFRLHGGNRIDQLEYASKDIPRWREILDACKVLGYDADLCDGLYRRLRRAAPKVRRDA